jgi:hypothetical protein
MRDFPWPQTDRYTSFRSIVVTIAAVALLLSAGTAYFTLDSHRVKCVSGTPMSILFDSAHSQAEYDHAYDEAFRVCPPGMYNQNQPGLRP